MTHLQREVYTCFTASTATRKLLNANGKKSARVLSAITSLKKLCNHPKLIYDTMRAAGKDTEGFEVRLGPMSATSAAQLTLQLYAGKAASCCAASSWRQATLMCSVRLGYSLQLHERWHCAGLC